MGTLGTLREPWEPWEPLLGNLGAFTWEPGNLYLGTFTWEPLLGTWEPWGNRFWSCSGLLRNLYYGLRPQSFCCWGIKGAYYHNSPHLHTFAQRCKDCTLTVKKRDAFAATIPRTSCTCFQKFVKLKADSLFYKVCRLQDRLCFVAQ